jgi:hypothetical protein
MNNTRMTNSVRNLANLYTVVIGVALSAAIVSLFDPQHGFKSITFSSLLTFISFVGTLIPFYHGALRHLDEEYIESQKKFKSWVLFVDFYLLFIHGIVFVILALLLIKQVQFIITLSVLLAIDALWGYIIYRWSPSSASHKAELKWSKINLIFVIVTVGFLVITQCFFSVPTPPIQLAWFIAVVCLIRTLVDYLWCWSYYFPENSA